MAKKKGQPKTGGRVMGTPNKATAAAREAIATFVDGNVHRLQTWLDTIANGTPANKKKGIKAAPGDPALAFQLLQSVIEYHVPKLARTDLTSGGKALPRSVNITVVPVVRK